MYIVQPHETHFRPKSENGFRNPHIYSIYIYISSTSDAEIHKTRASLTTLAKLCIYVCIRMCTHSHILIHVQIFFISPGLFWYAASDVPDGRRGRTDIALPAAHVFLLLDDGDVRVVCLYDVRLSRRTRRRFQNDGGHTKQ